LSQVLLLLGYPDRSRRISEDVLNDAEAHKAPADLGHAMLQACHTLLLHRDYRAVLKLSHRLLKLAREHELETFLQYAERVRQWARLAIGRRSQDIVKFTETLNALRAGGNKMRAPLMLGQIAEALAANDRAQEALEVIAEAMEVTERTGERWTEAELYRLKGVIALTRNGLDAIQEAEACFRRSIDIARGQAARLWELRAATSLARLWRDRGKRPQARDLLAPVYGWFTEGFETRDLKDAKALLDDLS
jgi:predicted ATPase